MGTSISAEVLTGFLMVLARVSGVFALAPLPGTRQSSPSVRIVLALALTIALAPGWLRHPVSWPRSGGGATVLWLGALLAAEMLYGATLGLVAGVLNDCLPLAAQIFGIQAGYGYASTIDPNTEADSGVLLVASQTMAWLLFFALGLDRWLVRSLAGSLASHPPGSWTEGGGGVQFAVLLGEILFQTAVRVALPIVGLLVLVDLTLALFGRVSAQLQLLSLAFPAKMLATIVILAAGAPVWARVYEQAAAAAIGLMRRAAGG